MLGTSLITLMFIAALQQAPVTIVQKTSGWCSPAIANVVGNVTVNCIGVDPRALKLLNTELSRKNLQLAEKIREADEWTKRYKELEARLNQSGDDSALSRQAEEYLHQGDLEKAGDILDQILGSEDKQTAQTAANHFNRALVFELQFHLADAQPHLKKAYLLAGASESSPEEVEYGHEYAYDLLRQNDSSDAEPVLLAILDKARKLAEENPTDYKPTLAAILNNLGVLYLDTDRIDQGEAVYQEVVTIYTELAKTNPTLYQPQLAGSLNNLGLLYDSKRKSLPAALTSWTALPAESAYLAALNIQEPLVKENPSVYEYQHELADILTDQGNLYRDTNRVKDAETAYKKALDIRRQLAKINPAYQTSLAVTLYDVGDLYNDTGEAAKSEAAYQEALDIFRQAAKANLTTYQPYVAGMLYMLALVHIAMKNLPQAKMEIEECVDINRKRSKANPEAGDDLARSLIIATVTQQESTRKCELASEAASVAQNPQLKDLAIKKKASVCTLE